VTQYSGDPADQGGHGDAVIVAPATGHWQGWAQHHPRSLRRVGRSDVIERSAAQVEAQGVCRRCAEQHPSVAAGAQMADARLNCLPIARRRL